MVTKHISLEVPGNQYRFVLKLLKSLPSVRVQDEPAPLREPTPAEQAIYDSVAQGFRELKLMREGKLQARPIQEILDELEG